MTEIKSINTCERLTSGSLLARNTAFNFLGQSAPLLVAIFAIPLLLNGLGTDRFGILTLAWIIIGYFSLFDLGLGRTLTKLVAEKLGSGDADQIPAIIWTCLLLTLILGAGTTLLVVLISPWLIHHVLQVPEILKHETSQAFLVLGICVPVVISTAALRGILEAQQRFGLVNIARITNGLFSFIGPLVALSFSSNLAVIVTVLAAGRLFFGLVYLLLCFHSMPSLYCNIKLKFNEVPPMLSLGGWMTVSNIVSPIMVYFDRFIIGAWVSVAAVAYYATPYEVVTKLWLIPNAVNSVLFPAFAASFATDRRRTALLFDRGLKLLFLGLFPITLLIVILAKPGLELWLGKEFAQNSTGVFQILAIGVLLNSPARVAFTLVQATGRPDLTAKLHVIEFPLYLLALWLLVGSFGIKGAAVAWTLRTFIDTFILFTMANRLLKGHKTHLKGVEVGLVMAVLALMLAMLPMGFVRLGVFILLVGLMFTIGAWFLLMDSGERALLVKHLRMKQAHL